MPGIKDIFEILNGLKVQDWTKDQWLSFLVGGLFCSLLTWRASKFWPRPSVDSKDRMAFDKHKIMLARRLDKLRIRDQDRRIRIWNDNLTRQPVHVVFPSRITSRVLLSNGVEKVVQTNQLVDMNENQ